MSTSPDSIIPTLLVSAVAALFIPVMSLIFVVIFPSAVPTLVTKSF